MRDGGAPCRTGDVGALVEKALFGVQRQNRPLIGMSVTKQLGLVAVLTKRFSNLQLVTGWFFEELQKVLVLRLGVASVE